MCVTPENIIEFSFKVSTWLKAQLTGYWRTLAPQSLCTRKHFLHSPSKAPCPSLDLITIFLNLLFYWVDLLTSG